MKNLFYILLILIAFVSCKDSKTANGTDNNTKATAENFKSIEVNIEGMTCEIGCARLIQSKLSKVDGVAYTNVNFESKKGIFTFDANKLTSGDITEKINKIAGGDLYSVSKTTELDKVIKKSPKEK